MKKIVYKIVPFLFLGFLFTQQIQAQGGGAASIQVDALSDGDIMNLYQNAKARGLSDQEFAALARQRGMNETEVSKLMQRVAKVSQGGATGNGAGGSNFYAQRQAVQIGGQDLFEVGDSTNSSMSSYERKIFGYEVFHNKALNFTPNLNMPTPKNYILGTGDQLIIQIYGIAQATIPVTINTEGKVVLPNVGVENLGGLTIEAAKSVLIAKLGTRYPGLTGPNPSSFVMLTIGNIRSIKINMVGEIKKPGTYQLPSYVSLFNALYAAGGPNPKGSFRHIQVYRNNTLLTEIDIYDFLLNGVTKKNIRLEDNDVILVPIVKKRVEVAGEVRRPGLYELNDKETLKTLVDMAGGFTDKAYRQTASIRRFSDIQQQIVDVPQRDFASFQMEDGDEANFGSLLKKFENRVQATGAINRSGEFELTTGMKLKDLIDRAGGLRGDALTTRATVYRTKADFQQEAISVDLNLVMKEDALSNLTLQREDILSVSSVYDVKESYFVRIQGEVNQPGIFPYVDNMSVGDLVVKAGGFNEAASGSTIEIVRRVKERPDMVADVIKISINKNYQISPAEQRIVLQPFDQVFVRTSIGYKPLKMVFISGEVAHPGKYAVDKQEMLVSDLLGRADGLLKSANVNGAILIRRTEFYKTKSANEEHLENLKELRKYYQSQSAISGTEANRLAMEKVDKEIAQINEQQQKNQVVVTSGYGASTGSGSSINDLFFGNPTNTATDSTGAIKTKAKKTDEENIEEVRNSVLQNITRNLKDVNLLEDDYEIVSLQLDKIIAGIKGDDMVLRDGDILYIPTILQTVKVKGEVFYPVSIKFIDGQSLKEYINQSGGFKPSANRRNTYSIAANGEVSRTHSFLFFRSYPRIHSGSQIIVPAKPKTIPFGIDKIIGITTSALTLFLLFKSLN